MDLVSRGRKLVLQYTGGSPCGTAKSSKSSPRSSISKGNKDSAASSQPHRIESVKSDSDDEKAQTKRKSTTISFLCDRDPSSGLAGVSFVGVSPDECSYFFEARSVHACVGAEPHKPGSVGPGSVFGIILVIAVLVYALGGVFYNRTVTNARGWRQLPNYSLWAGIWSFVSVCALPIGLPHKSVGLTDSQDLFIALFSSCARCLPSRRGYSRLHTGSRNRNSEAENRLIDQLDEEWDD